MSLLLFQRRNNNLLLLNKNSLIIRNTIINSLLSSNSNSSLTTTTTTTTITQNNQLISNNNCCKLFNLKSISNNNNRQIHTTTNLNLSNEQSKQQNESASKKTPKLGTQAQNQSFPPGNPTDKPKLEHLVFIEDKLKIHLPKFFTETHPYYLYTTDVIFENYFNETKPKITTGAGAYALQLTSLRLKAHFKYSYLKVDLLKITIDDTDGYVKVRWRVNALSGLKTMIKPWRIKLWKAKETVKQESEWIDGISTFYVRGDGRIVKHRVERVITQKNEELAKNKTIDKLKNINVDTALCTNDAATTSNNKK